MTRQRLPDRRPSATRTIRWAAHRFDVTLGFGRDGRPREVFADGPKSGTDLRHLVADACVWASLLLQHGVTPDTMRKSLGSVPVRHDPSVLAPASLLGAIADLIAEEDAAALARLAWDGGWP